jgi:hypothetical protein
MRKRHVIAIVVAIALVVILVLFYGPAAMGPGSKPIPDNTAGPAEGGALETGGALNPEAGDRRLPARDMPDTITQYPPTGPETASPPPPKQ